MKATKILLILAISTASLSANATWLCSVHNARDQAWNGKGQTRAIALEKAMGVCSQNSEYARNCVVKNCAKLLD